MASCHVIFPVVLVTLVIGNSVFASDLKSSWERGRNRSGRSIPSLVPIRYGPNVCYLQQGDGCKFRVTVLPDECGHSSNWNYGMEKRKVEEGDDPHTPADDPASLQKLEALEEKLVKMMEDLSVRSLRHVREIRSDLRQMATSMSHLKTGNRQESTQPNNHQPPRACPPEFIAVGIWKSCYRFSNFEATWNEAREYCSIFGSALLSLDSMKEANIIDYLIKSNTGLQEAKGWWTSGSYVVRSQRWMWSPGQPHQYQQPNAINFSRWAASEPTPQQMLHCIALFKSARYYWHGSLCTDRYNFICQIEAN